MTLTLEDFKQTLTRISPYVKRTSLLRCETLEKHFNLPVRVFLKLENEQPTKSFKVRGAFNALLTLSPSEKAKGVITRSSGNFAQALAYAGQLLEIPVTIVLPSNVPEIKKRKTQEYGPHLVFAGPTHQEGDQMVEKLRAETGATPLHPYNHIEVIKGQGTIALEVYDQLPTAHHFFCPISGGGLMGGCSTALKILNPKIETIGIEPEGAADYYLYRIEGRTSPLTSVHTICDGLRAPQVGTLDRPLLDQHVDRVSTVSDASVIQTMKLLKDHYNLMIEPSGAASLAGLLGQSLTGDTVCVISGANIDASYFEELTSREKNLI